MPHNQKDKPEKMDELPHGAMPNRDEEHAWRPSDEASDQQEGRAPSEVLDESDNEWRPSDSATE